MNGPCSESPAIPRDFVHSVPVATDCLTSRSFDSAENSRRRGRAGGGRGGGGEGEFHWNVILANIYIN